jgi:uncharacterized protein
MKPWIKLFKTFNKYYFYDVNLDHSTEISKDLFEILENRNGEIDVNSDSQVLYEEIENLKKQGYLGKCEIEEIEHPLTFSVEDYIQRKLNFIVLQLTHNCNLRCRYCAYTENVKGIRTHSKDRMSFETVEKALKLLKENSIDSKKITIGFYGGEPLLEFDLLKKSVELSKELFKNKEIKYTVTTNATLLSEEKILFLEENNFQLMISFDGPQLINDSNRVFASSNKSVFIAVISKLEHIIKNHPKLKENLSINMVIDPTYDMDLYINVFEEYPFLKEIRVGCTIVEDYSGKGLYNPSQRFSYDYNAWKTFLYLKQFLKLKTESNLFVETLLSKAIDNVTKEESLKKPIGKVFAPSGPCMPGLSKLFVSVKGKLLPCEEIDENNEVACIGHIDTGIELDKVKRALNIARSRKSVCVNCYAFRFCKACIKFYELGSDGKININENSCKEFKDEFKNLMKHKVIIREIERQAYV